MDLFELVGNIAIKNSDAIKALDDTSAQGVKTESKLTKTFSGIGKAALGVGKVMGTAMLAGATAVGTLAVKAMNLGGELEQNMGGSEQVFGKHADKMQSKAKEAFSNMGLSTSDYLATANKMGALFQGAGFSVEESMNLSSDAMQRAADVASIMGIDTSSAMEAVAGAAKGNFTMMDNLGVAMNETSLEAYALEKGMSKAYSEMSQQEKIGVAMQMFLDKTSYAAGNYAKENETLAGSLGTAKAALTNFLDGSGDVDSLVKAFQNAANVIVNSLQTLLPRLVTGLVEIVNKILPLIAPLLQKLLPAVISGAKTLIEGLVAALPSVLDTLLSALPALIEGVKTVFNALVEALPQLVEALVSALPTLLPMLIDALVDMILTLCTMLPQIIQPIIDYLPEIYIKLVEALMNNLPALIKGLIDLVVALLDAIPQIVAALVEAGPVIVSMLLKGIVSAFPNLISGILKLIPSLFKALISALSLQFVSIFVWIKGIWLSVKDYVKPGLDAAKKVIDSVWKSIQVVIKSALNTIKTIIQNVMKIISSVMKGDWEGVKKAVSNIIDAMKAHIRTSLNAIKSIVSKIANGVKDAMEKPMKKARDTIKGIVDKIKGFFSGMKLKFPKIPLPHFSIKPKGWKVKDLLDGTIPKLGVDFYAKGGIMTEPTLFNYNPATGRASVGGEKGDEAIAPIDTLRQYIREEVRAENNGIVQRIERIIELLVQFFPEMLEALDISFAVDGREMAVALASPMNDELGKIAIRKGRGR